MRIHLFLFCFLGIGLVAHAQTGYKIHFKIQGLHDTTAYLGYYYGESTFVRDTAKVDSKGEFTFEGKQPLLHGVYMLVLDKTKIFELVVGANQNFSMETSTADYIKDMKVKNDQDNKLFFENMVFNMERHKEADPYLKVVNDSTLTEDKKKDARAAFTKINDKVTAYQEDVITKYPTTITAKLFKANKAVKIPDPPKKANGSIDSTFQLKWYREHFFDYFDLADDALLRLPQPLYNQKVDEYLDKLYVPQRDSVVKAIDKMVAKAKPNQETFKYLLWHCMIKYQTPEIMGLDEVFVDLYDKYFATGAMDFWANDKMKKNLKDYADRVRLSMLGKTAPDLIMKDSHDQLKSLYNIKNKYTIVFFFSPECGHCRKETPKLVEFYTKDKAKYNLEVFAVSTDTSMTKMKEFIKEMKMPWVTVNFYYSAVGHYQQLYDAPSTPTLYVLDDKKKIIGKKVPIEKLGDFLTNYEKYHKPKVVSKT
ncbi:MAG TPA: thioredoxin-like domain-containing protein [Cyclobacteriaceae bacterium]|nr:thioredoxin-like domain-containing protein [Cyclobacteriaceae bacterium]